MAIRCCKGCKPPKRHTACWGTCPDYLKEKAEDSQKKEAAKKFRDEEDMFLASRARARYRALKKYKKH